MGEKWEDKRERCEEGGVIKGVLSGFVMFHYTTDNTRLIAKQPGSPHRHFHRLRSRLPGRVRDGKRVSGGPLGRDMETPGVRGPNCCVGWIEGDGLGVGNVVANLRGFATADDGRRNIKGADGQVRASKYFNLFAIFLAALLGLAFCIASFDLAVRVVTRKKDKDDISGNDSDGDERVEERILERRFARNLRVRIHGAPAGRFGPRRFCLGENPDG